MFRDKGRGGHSGFHAATRHGAEAEGGGEVTRIPGKAGIPCDTCFVQQKDEGGYDATFYGDSHYD